MKRLRSFILLAVSICTIVASGCAPENRNPNRTFSARQVDSLQGTGIQGVDMEIYRIKTTGYINQSGKKITVERAVTDTDGAWTMQFYQASDKYYHLLAEHPDYYDYTVFFNGEENIDSVILMAKRGIIRLDLVDSSGLYSRARVEVLHEYTNQNRVSRCVDDLPYTGDLDAVAGAWNRVQISLYEECVGTADPELRMDSVFVEEGIPANLEIRF